MRPTPPTADHGDPVPTTERPAPVGPVGRPSVTRRARPPRALVLRAVALGAALLTATVVAGDLRALHRRAAALGPDVGVVAATRDLPLGTRLGADDLRVLTRPARTVAPDAVGSVDDAIGRTVAVPLLAGDIVRNRTLTAGAAAGIDGLIPSGMRAVRLRPADGARPPTGSTVDVLALVGPPESTGAPAVAVAVGATVLAVAAESSGESAVTILVTEAEAPGVVAANLGGPIGLALAPPPATGRSDRVPAPPG